MEPIITGSIVVIVVFQLVQLTLEVIKHIKKSVCVSRFTYEKDNK